MKTIQKRWLPLFLLAAVTFLFPGCQGNDPDDDLAGVITLKMRNGNYRSGSATNLSVVWGAYLYIDEDNNFSVHTDGNFAQGYGTGDIVDMGKKKLSQITTLPSSGWIGKVAVQKKHGYIFRSKEPDASEYTYVKLYVVDFITGTSGGIIGAEVQYCEWNPKQ